MKPAARAQAAIEILDEIQSGRASEAALTGWARRSRFAGSKDRAAIRDLVFDAIRCKRSFAALGGSTSGRGLILGSLRAQGIEAESVFSGEAYAPPPLTPAEHEAGDAPAPGAQSADLPDWLWSKFQTSLGAQASDVAQALRHRAPVHLRVNQRRISRDEAIKQLNGAGIVTCENPVSETALTVVEGARRIRQAELYLDGRIELQDAASQAIVDHLPLENGRRVLDFCAGGGGKSLAMAARADITLFAHDADAARMSDLPSRASRAQARIECCTAAQVHKRAPFDLILCDAPCSGSGSWRRAPDAKWAVTPERLVELGQIQSDILGQAASLLGPNGVLAYATCSVLADENEQSVERFKKNHDAWRVVSQRRWLPDAHGDGFYLALLTRD